MNSLPSAGSGFGGITQALQSGLLPSLGSLGGLLGSIGSIGSIGSLPGGVEPPAASTGASSASASASSTSSSTAAPATATATAAATIQTLQPTSFAPAAGSASAAPAARVNLAKLVQKRKQLASSAKSAKAPEKLAAKKTVGKPQRKTAKAAAAATAAAAADAADDKKAAVGPWTKEEIEELKRLVEQHGAGQWEQKASAMSTGRTAKAVHTRWLRESGRIIDMPRGQQNMLSHEMTSMDAERQRKIMEESGYLLPVLTGSLGAAFGQSTVPK
jgi:hypothetical protein